MVGFPARHIAQAARVCRSEFVALTSVRMLRSFRFLVIAIVSVSCTGQPSLIMATSARSGGI